MSFPSIDLSVESHFGILCHSLKYTSQQVTGLLLSAQSAASSPDGVRSIDVVWPLFHGPACGPLFEIALHTARTLALSRSFDIIGIYQAPAANALPTPELDPITAHLIQSISHASPLYLRFIYASGSTLPLVSNYSCFTLKSNAKGLISLGGEVLLTMSPEIQKHHSALASSMPLQIQVVAKTSDFQDHLYDITKDFTNQNLYSQLIPLLH